MIDMRAHKSFSSREPVQFTSWTTLLIDKFICCEAFGQFYDSFGGSKCHCRKGVKLHLPIVMEIC